MSGDSRKRSKHIWNSKRPHISVRVCHRRKRVGWQCSSLGPLQVSRRATGISGGFLFLEQLAQDVRYGFRGLRRNPGFAATAVLTLSVGIAATNTAFTIVNTVLIRDLPFPSADRIFQLGVRRASDAMPLSSYPDFRDWERVNTTFEGLAAFEQTVMSVSDQERAAEQVEGTYISGGTFRVLKTHPIIGRDFVAADDRPGAPKVTILANRLWRQRYAGDPSIVGQTIRVNAQPSTVIGVMPDGFEFPFNTMVWVPLAAMPDLAARPRDNRFLQTIGRLKEGISPAAAADALNAINATIQRDHVATNAPMRIDVQRFRPGIGWQWYVVFGALMTAVGLLLFVSCANVATLQLARSLQRAREVSIRASLGATRFRIVRQLVVESVVLALVAGVIGLALSAAAMRSFVSVVDELGKPFWMNFSIDSTVFVFFAAICVATGLLFGIVPALNVSSLSPNEVLKAASSRTTTTGRLTQRFNTGIVVAEIIVTTVLLAGAISMMRHFAEELSGRHRIDTLHVLVMNLRLPTATYPTDKERAAFYQRLDERLASLPGIPSIAISSNIPFFNGVRRKVSLDGQVPTDGSQLPTAQIVRVGARYFETVGLPLLSGRPLTNADAAAGRVGAVIDERFARTFFQDGHPIGREVTFFTDGGSPQRVTIVGVAPTLRATSTETSPMAYVPYLSNAVPGISLLVRSNDHPSVTARLREEVKALDADLPLWDIRPLDEAVRRLLWVNRVFGGMFVAFAGIAVILAIVGIYGVVAYTMSQRTQEIGIRMALGASTSRLWWTMIRPKVIQIGIGIVVGTASAFMLLGLMGGLLVGRFGQDRSTLSAGAVLLLVVAVLSMLWPVWRAASTNPVRSLRYE
jgi:putative ABC transport system permease protein